MQDRPTAVELLDAMTYWLATLEHGGGVSLKYEARVAAHACRIVRRELAEPEAAAEADAADLTRILGRRQPESQPAVELARILAARIRGGAYDSALPELAAQLEPFVRRKLAVSRPGYEVEPPDVTGRDGRPGAASTR